MMNKILRITMACILSLIILTTTAGVIFAKDPNESQGAITPKIEVQEDDWLIISYSEKVKDKMAAVKELDAYISTALNKMISSSNNEMVILSGSRTMSANAQKSTHGSYVYASYSTSAYWTSSPASFWGSSNAYWAGTDPINCTAIGRYHRFELEEHIAEFTQVPTGWINNINLCTSGLYRVFNTWYLATSWSGLKATYDFSNMIIDQRDDVQFDFPSGEDPLLQPASWMFYG
jgi:hypothetical protein